MMTSIDIRILFIAFPDFFVVGKNPSRSEFDLAIKLDVTIEFEKIARSIPWSNIVSETKRAPEFDT